MKIWRFCWFNRPNFYGRLSQTRGNFLPIYPWYSHCYCLNPHYNWLNPQFWHISSWLHIPLACSNPIVTGKIGKILDFKLFHMGSRIAPPQALRTLIHSIFAARLEDGYLLLEIIWKSEMNIMIIKFECRKHMKSLTSRFWIIVFHMCFNHWYEENCKETYSWFVIQHVLGRWSAAPRAADAALEVHVWVVYPLINLRILPRGCLKLFRTP